MTETATAQPPTRNATLHDLATLLRDHKARAVDLVVPSPALRAVDTMLVIRDAPPLLTESGVTEVNGVYRPTKVADEGIAAKLGIPIKYLREMRAHAPDLYDHNVNSWLRNPRYIGERFLLRGMRGTDPHGPGIARALLSDKYQIIDHLDGLTAALAGVEAAGVEVDITGCDLTDRRMYVRIRCQAVAVHAPRLLRNYRSPFTGAYGADNPVVFAGFEIANSETGCGAFTLTPRLVFEVCANGMTITRDALRAVHLGGRLEEGPIRWSLDTQNKALELIKAKTGDAVRTFLDADYVRGVLDRIDQDAAKPITDPAATIKAVAKPMAWTEQQQNDILRHFISGGDVTAGGVLHAVTATAQTLKDADAAHELEAHGIRAMELAAGRS